MKRVVEREELNTGDLAQVFFFCPWSPCLSTREYLIPDYVSWHVGTEAVQ